MAKILVVDDDPDVVDACRMVLESQGHQVIGAGDPAEGEKLIASEKPDLIVLDIMMNEPDDGIAMAQRLRQAGNTQPIVMMSSISKVVGMDYGKDDEVTPVDAYLEKPVAPDVLIEKVNALLKK